MQQKIKLINTKYKFVEIEKEEKLAIKSCGNSPFIWNILFTEVFKYLRNIQLFAEHLAKSSLLCVPNPNSLRVFLASTSLSIQRHDSIPFAANWLNYFRLHLPRTSSPLPPGKV